MKKILIVLVIAAAFAACKSKSKNTVNTTDNATIKTDSDKTSAHSASVNSSADTAGFDINKIPVTDKDLGVFPYLKPPAPYSYNYQDDISAKNIKSVDKEYFAINGKLTPVKGKTYKINIERSRSDGKRFNAAEVEKSFTTTIDSLGGIQVNDVPVPQTEIKRIGNAELIDKQYGSSIDMNVLDEIKTFVIRTKNKQIWIQFTLMNEESGKITVLEKAN